MKPLKIKKFLKSSMLYLLFGLFLILVSACSNGSGSSEEASSETGSIAFNLAESAGSQIEVDGSNPSEDSSDATNKKIFSPELNSYAYTNEFFQITALDCLFSGVTTIEASVYTSDNDFLVAGGPWPCEAHQGTITGVPVGADLKVVVLARDADGNIIYRGEQTGLTVTAGQTTDAGTIIIESFVPTLSAPADQSEIANGDLLILRWVEITGAAEYWLVVSENNDLSDPIIDISVSESSYNFQNYTLLSTYYWQVIAVDFDGNSSIGSEIWSFTILNNPPTASIDSPSNESKYFWGEEITFIGSGNDHEDGTLTGESLVWTSSLDGIIGTGTHFSTNNLSIGTHTIRLTATDSHGATKSDTITVIILNNPPTVVIQNPTNDSQFPFGENISFNGTAVDREDGTLTGEYLVWTSSLNGTIGTGAKLSTNKLSVGIHTITLTATDSRGDTGSSTITVTILNNPPTVTIESPKNDESYISYCEGEICQYYSENESLLSFKGSAEDIEDGILLGSRLKWRSNLDGLIGTGTQFSPPKLSIGTHTITLTATDSQGAVGSDSVTIIIITEQGY